MGEIQRQGIYNSIIAYAGIVLGYINMGILFPFILTTDQIGLYAVIGAIGQIGNTLVRFGTPSIAIRYLPFYKGREERARFVGLQLLLVGLGAVLFALLYLLLKPLLIAWYQDQSPLFVSYSHLVVPFTWLLLLFELLFGFSRAYLLTVAAGFARDLLFRIVALALIIFYYFEWIDFDWFMWLYAFVYAVPSVFLLVYLMVRHSMPVSFKVGRLGSGIKEMMVYGGFVSLGSLSTVLISEVDKVMLAGLADLEAVGVYTIAAFFGSVIVAPARALLLVVAPLIAQFIKEGRMDKIATIYAKSSLNMLAVGLLVYIGLYVNLDNIFGILPPEFAVGRYVIIFIGFSKLVEMVTGANGDIIVNSRYFRYDLAFNILLAILAIGTNYLLIPIYGITGAAMSTLISMFLYNVLKTAFVYWKFGIQPFTVQTFYCLLVGVGAVGVDALLPRLEPLVLDLVLRSALVGGVYVLLLLYFNISPDINGLAAKMLNQARKRVGR